MAVIGSIRKRSGLLVGAIALSIFLFLLGDAVNNQFSVLGKSRSNDAGSVNGQNISYQDYSNQVNENVKNMEAQYKMSVGDQQRNAVSQQTWDDLVNKIVMEDASAKTGVVVSDDEMVSLTTTENASPMIKQPFGGERFNPMYVKQFLANIDIDEKGQEPGYKRKAWNQLVKEVKKGQLQNKYAVLVAKGVGNVPNWMAENLYYEANKSADFKYVELPYSEVNDNDIKYTDADLKDYLGKNAAKFTAPDETRVIRYVAFDITPSSVDSATALKGLTDKLDEFKKGEKKSDDSLFVKLYSETSFDDLYRTKDQLAGSSIADSLFGSKVGTVIGPYVEGNTYKFAKVSARKMMSDSVKVKEIVFSFANVKTEAEQKTRLALIDSLYKAIDSLHADFGTIAAQYSDDPASKLAGGVVGWVKFADPQYDEYYKSIVFHNGEPGKAYKYLDANNNLIKFVEIAEEKPSKAGIKVAYFTRSIIPSQETENEIYSHVTQFVSTTSTEDKFLAYIKSHEKDVKTAVNITKGSYDVMGLGSARSLVKWVYSAKRGDVSPIISLGSSTNDRKHIIAYLESVTGKGTPDLESVKSAVKSAYLQDKKYELLAKKITDAKASNIDDLAAKLGKAAIEADKVTFLNTNLPTGNEPAVAATGVALAQGKMSGPVKGNGGVFVVQKINGVDPPKPTDLTQQAMMLKQNSYMKARAASEALKKLAKIDDNRLNFEGGN
jgi:parvulin-like peptidyl-prolyl isomerase